MKVEFNCDDNVYMLDYIKGKPGIAALTKKNADFIEGALIIDSNYRREQFKEAPNKKFNVKDYSKKAGGLYCGSTGYWFTELINERRSYDECVWGAVIAIDRSNSTHLETTENGRELMHQRIVNACGDKDSLIKALKQGFDPSDYSHLFAKMLAPDGDPKLLSMKKNAVMFYPSFASKFCSEASHWLLGEWLYSKYDSVVAENLPAYYEIYMGKKVKKGTYKPKTTGNEKKDFENRLEVYEQYCKDIEEILDELKNSYGTILNKNEIDHIIWYGMKGK